MPVTCPHCATRYVLPESLIGPGGARVRCPRCREPFSVGPDGAEIEPLPAPAMAAAKPAEAPAPPRGETIEPKEVAGPAPAVASNGGSAEVSDPAGIAHAVLDDLAAHSGEAISASQAEGRLFREFGAVIAEAFEFYRRRVGPNADPAPFRAALKERWGVDLEPGQPSRRLS